MTSYSALSPISAGIYAALNVSGVTSLATGGVGDDIAQATTYPFVLFDVQEEPQFQMGSQPGRSHQLSQIDLLVHVFSQYGGLKEAQGILDACIAALVTPPTVSGYSDWASFYDGAVNLGEQVVGGVKVKELVGRFRLFVELT